MPYSAEYRKRIFDLYASRSKEDVNSFDLIAARKWGKAYDYFLRQWLPHDKNAQILDVACGGGRLLHFFKEKGYVNLTGVDISPEQVSLSKQVVDQVYEKNILDFLETTNQKFDLIVGLDIIEHLYKAEVFGFLDLCYSRLNNGGRLILATPNADSPFFNSVRYGDFTHENAFTPNALNWVARISGFKQGTARELNPVPLRYGFLSTIRFLLWKIICVGIYAWNIIETGGPGSKVYTRNFLFSALKSRGD